jgi:CRISPR-associated protein Cst1
MTLDFSQPIGDPMVEIGRLGLVEFCQKNKFENFEEIKQFVEKLFNIYTFKTSGRIGQVFSSNSKFTHNSTGKDLNERLQQAVELYDELLKESYTGYCLSCGKKDNLCNVSKTIFPLTTGNSNTNFTSNFSNQFLICKECMTSLFFTPINMKKIAGRMGFMISNNQEINTFWSEENIEGFNANLVKNIDSLVDSKINIFENFIYKTIEELQEENLFGDITFYLISNVDKGSEINLIHIFENQMNFINQVAPNFFKNSLPTKDKDEWNYLVFKYSNKERKDDGKNVKFEDEVIKNKDYKSTMKYFNPLIKNFIQGKSILYFLKQNHCSWHLTQIYLKEIQNMREERLLVLKKVADRLQELNDGDKEFIRKIVFPLERTKSHSEFREKLRELMRKFLTKSNEPLFTAEEMVFQILPSGENWAETKDILLIALYEKLTLDDEIKEEFEKHITNEGDSENE